MSFENMLSDAAIKKEDYFCYYRSTLTLDGSKSGESMM